MDAHRYFDLYLAETHEHLQALQRSLLSLETGGGAGVAEAFRAAHTIKGLSAAMSYEAAAAQAHLLEELLVDVRGGTSPVSRELVDRLLAQADLLESAVAAAVAGGAPETIAAEPVAAGGSSSVSAGRASPPAGATHVLHVLLRDDAPMKAARALLILRQLQHEPGVLGSSPDPLPDDFSGQLEVFLGGDAAAERLRRATESAGDVAAVTLRPIRSSRAVAVRQVRVAEPQLEGLAEWIGELSVLNHRLSGAPAGEIAADALQRMRGLLNDLQHAVLQLRMAPLRDVLERLPRVVRDACRTTGREAELVIEGEDIELDRAILYELNDPLVHLLRNAVGHGIEPPAARRLAGKPSSGRILLRAEREGNSVRLTLQDDGAGVDRERVLRKAREAQLVPESRWQPLSDDELFRILCHAGFSTATQLNRVSGRGVGLDVVVNRVRALGGAIEMRTTTGAGTTFLLRLPITRALARALRVRVGGEDYAIPLTHISEVMDLDGCVESDGAHERLRVRDARLPLVRLRHVLQVSQAGSEISAVITGVGERRLALAVDELVGHEQILIKPLDAAPGMLPLFSGATLLEDGRPALVLDPLSV